MTHHGERAVIDGDEKQNTKYLSQLSGTFVPYPVEVKSLTTSSYEFLDQGKEKAQKSHSLPDYPVFVPGKYLIAEGKSEVFYEIDKHLDFEFEDYIARKKLYIENMNQRNSPLKENWLV